MQFTPLIPAQLFYELVHEFHLVIFLDHTMILLLTFITVNHFSEKCYGMLPGKANGRSATSLQSAPGHQVSTPWPSGVASAVSSHITASEAKRTRERQNKDIVRRNEIVKLRWEMHNNQQDYKWLYPYRSRHEIHVRQEERIRARWSKHLQRI